jgi:hypothetical protein
MLRRHFLAISFVVVCAAWAGLVLQAQATRGPSDLGTVDTAADG